MTAVDRLIAEAVEQGHGGHVADTSTMKAVATIIANATKRQAVSHDRQAA